MHLAAGVLTAYMARLTVEHGLRLVIGSWNTMLMWFARDVTHGTFGKLQEVLPRSGSRRRSCRAAAVPSRMIEFAVTDLPQPLSPTIAKVHHAQPRRHAVDRAVHAVRGAKMRLQVFNLEQRISGSQPLAMRGSSAFAQPSPSRLTASTVQREEQRGKNTM